MPESPWGWTSLLAAVILAGCGSDRTAGGTTGTEAGNALSARLSLPDGTPAAGALVVVRPGGSTSSQDADRWIRDTADAHGDLSLRLPDGAWTLEARWKGFGLRAELRPSVDQDLRDTLVPLRTLSGEILGAGAGTLVSLPGLGVSAVTDATGKFAIDSVPAQEMPLSLDGLVSWSAPAETTSILVSSARPGAVFRDGETLRTAGDGLVWEIDASLVPAGTPVVFDENDREVGSRWASARSGRFRFWVDRPLEQGSTMRLCALVRRGSDPAPGVFGDGYRLAVVPDLDSSLGNLSAGGGSFRSSSSAVRDSSEGLVVPASLGSVVGSLDSAALPAQGAFAFALRARMVATGVESLGLLDWNDPATGAGLHLGLGGGKLEVRVGTRDTTIAWDPGLSWFGAALSWDGQILTVATDGQARLRWLLPDVLSDRSRWTRREVGLGGGLRVSSLFTFAGTRDAAVMSAPIGGVVR